MKYIIVDPDELSNIELKNILNDIKMLDFQGSFRTFEEAEKNIRGGYLDVAFIRIGDVALNAYKLTKEIRAINPLARVIFITNQEEYAIEAFECEANGLLLSPFNRDKIQCFLQKKY
ncbi:MAG: response regulator [Clostridiales bacterium]|nr:response regulator [Clostridiales bacterium]